MDKKSKLKKLQVRSQLGAVTPEMAKKRKEEKEAGVQVPQTHAEMVAAETKKISSESQRIACERFERTLKLAQKMIYGV